LEKQWFCSQKNSPTPTLDAEVENKKCIEGYEHPRSK
jgi:hypothetical protein